MPNHKLLSPTSTYHILSQVMDLNKDLVQAQKPFQQKNQCKLTNLPEITTCNGEKLTQNKNIQSQIAGILQRSAAFGQDKRFPSVSITRKPANSNMYNGGKMEAASNKPTDQISGQAKKTTPTGPVTSRVSNTSSQSVILSASRVNTKEYVRRNPDRLSRSNKATYDKDYVEDSCSDFEDSFDFSEVKSKGNIESLRLPYTAKEDIKILNHVLSGSNIGRTGSLSLWRELEMEMLDPKRTYQSLKNRFLRNIKPHLLTKYRRFLTSETIARVARKFPELKRGVRLNNIVMEEEKERRQVKASTGPRVVVLPPLPASQPQASKQPKNPPPSIVLTPSAAAAISQQAPTPNHCSVLEELETRDTGPVPGKDSAPSIDTSTAVELFKPGKSHSLPVQSFQYTKIIKTLRDKTNLNLNIALLNDQSSSLLSKWTGPVKVDIVVSVSSIQESGGVEPAKADILRLEEIPSQPPPAKEKKRKKKRIKPRPSPKARLRYVLKLKKCNRRKLLNLTPVYKQTLSGLLQRIESNIGERKKAAAKSGDYESGRMMLRSQARKDAEEASSQTTSNSTQETNCSVEDDSDYSQVYREVRKTYQLVTEPEEREEEDVEAERKRIKTDKNPEKSNILLKNMVGMLSPCSKVFANKQNITKSMSKKL